MAFLWLWFYMELHFYVKTFKGNIAQHKKHLDFFKLNK